MVAPGIASRTLVTMIADSLRQEIITGQLAPGAPIRQEEYSERYKVSRTPLREAFRLLDVEGWVRIRPRAGVEVSRFSSDEVQELLTMRLLLEPLAIRVGARTHSADQVAPLIQLHKRCAVRPNNDVDEGTFDEAALYDVANQDFHFALYLMPDTDDADDPLSGNLRTFWSRYSRYRRVYYSRRVNSIEASLEEHSQLLHAWTERDADLAERLLARHIYSAGCKLLAELSDNEAPPISPHLSAAASRYGIS